MDGPLVETCSLFDFLIPSLSISLGNKGLQNHCQGGGGRIGTYSFKLEGYINGKMDTGKFCSREDWVAGQT